MGIFFFHGGIPSGVTPQLLEQVAEDLLSLLRGAGSRDSSWLGEFRAALRQLDEDLSCDILISGVAGTSTLCLTRSDIRELRPLCQALTEKLGSGGFPIASSRSQLSLPEALRRAEEHLEGPLEGSRFRAGFTRGHLLEITFLLPGCAGHDDPGALAAARELCLGLLGEERMEDWVLELGVAPLPAGGSLRVLQPGAKPDHSLSTLVATIDAATAGIRQGLTPGPFRGRAEEGWTMLETTPFSSGDSEAAGMDDLIMATTCVPELLKVYLEGLPVASHRFSSCGELFVYLKYRDEGESELRLARRTQLEDALGEVLATESLGAVVGTGHGIQHSYVLLALEQGEEPDHLQQALGALCAAVERQGPAGPAWFLFCDTAHGLGWWACAADGPPPPG